MLKYLNIPNIICITRVLFSLIFCFFIFQALNVSEDSVHLSFFISKFFFSCSVIFVILLDALDGILARGLNQETEFGAKLDIFCDRLVENIYLIFYVFFFKSLAWWVLAFFLIRGFLVDFISFKRVKPLGESFLRSSRFMRAFYGFLKVLIFIFLIWQTALFTGFPFNLTEYLVLLTVFISLLRALPSFFKKIS